MPKSDIVDMIVGAVCHHFTHTHSDQVTCFTAAVTTNLDTNLFMLFFFLPKNGIGRNALLTIMTEFYCLNSCTVKFIISKGLASNNNDTWKSL